MNQPNKLPSPDIYPGLDDELDAVYERNVSKGIAQPAENTPEAELGAVVVEQLQQQAPEMALAETLREWANPQLQEALIKWRQFGSQSSMQNFGVPPTTEILAVKNPNFAETIRRLYEARQALIDSGEVNPADEAVGETMKLVLIPWRKIMDDIGGANPSSFFDAIYEMRKVQGIDQADYINDDLREALEADKPIYRDPGDPSKLLNAPEYLRKKLEQDGDWGIFLVQTSDEAGLDRLKGQSPDQLTANGADHLEVAGHNVDGLGIFEWYALTLQEHPRKLSATSDYSWMLANRLDVNGDWCVPIGDWDVGQVESDLYGAGDSDDDIRPRLAVM